MPSKVPREKLLEFVSCSEKYLNHSYAVATLVIMTTSLFWILLPARKFLMDVQNVKPYVRYKKMAMPWY